MCTHGTAYLLTVQCVCVCVCVCVSKWAVCHCPTEFDVYTRADDVKAHCYMYIVDNKSLILSVADSISKADCGTFRPHRLSSTAYKTLELFSDTV